jgi:hypothetical protein
MNVASMTEMAISHGLGAGRLSVIPDEPAMVVLAIDVPGLRLHIMRLVCAAAGREKLTDAPETANDSRHCVTAAKTCRGCEKA